MESNHSLAGRSRYDLLPARAPLAAAAEEPTQETPAQANPQYPDQGEFWLGWPVTVGLPPVAPMPPPAPVPAAPIPAAPIPAAPTDAADTLPVRVKSALRRSTRVNIRVNPNALPIPVGPTPAGPIPAAPIPAAPIPAADAPPVRDKPALRRSTPVNKGVNNRYAANLPWRAMWRP